MRGPFLFLCKILSEFRFRRKANEIRNRRAGRNNGPCCACSNSLSLPAPLADLAWRGAASASLLVEPSDAKALKRNLQ
jgi:hypothetical protein